MRTIKWLAEKADASVEDVVCYITALCVGILSVLCAYVLGMLTCDSVLEWMMKRMG